MSEARQSDEGLAAMMAELGVKARRAGRQLAIAPTDAKNTALQEAANELRADAANIIAANQQDMKLAEAQNVGAARLDRIMLDEARLEGIAQALEAIIKLDDPVGQSIAHWQVESGLDITRVRVPLGVIGVIYESRPNVTADAAALCLKSGNAVILRGSSEIQNSARLIHGCFARALKTAGLDENCVQIVDTPDRAAVGMMLAGLDGNIDIIVPRGGKGLVGRVQDEARVPVFAHLDGVCHIYVHAAADLDMARAVLLNAKMRRTGICGAAETLLVDAACADTHLAPLITALLEAGCAVRGDDAAQQADSRVSAATEDDWYEEYLDAVIAVKTVTGLDEAVAHITQYGSGHTEAIITANDDAAADFLNRVDSAIVMHNASTQFADGGEFGMGAEIGIATGRFHARGPVGLEQLTSFKYAVRGSGQTRPK
ncbi:glutamate-5-semialdehyde dehydrogenase [Alphaproteobacteria bacterium]|jgi:glutamate-5-semialdehyde dehydrogenase|nr:glutamate-5-semialdehyde dehydrogenase [Alphaproteobacteria bacterium]MDA8666251.1 glutamate-5-semialdehyde dehydrogenase [Alphaproteobacteria bacterium]MDA8780485.1 glutamate-5-semialdehyde dehydrogenase [Alphaproteobacteria bacterium]MDB2405947.1 glutamate-5-semialdehyde dehydrogenase [Alphaproteobacteria bacterium]MDB2431422.1 glutamate-5-semialdehyde dehydrogenase [Alphaproteobacteria bacterium]